VTHYTVFVVDLASRRVQILGSTPSPEMVFMQQIVRTLTMAEAGVLSQPRVLICDRDRKWSRDVPRSTRCGGRPCRAGSERRFRPVADLQGAVQRSAREAESPGPTPAGRLSRYTRWHARHASESSFVESLTAA